MPQVHNLVLADGNVVQVQAPQMDLSQLYMAGAGAPLTLMTAAPSPTVIGLPTTIPQANPTATTAVTIEEIPQAEATVASSTTSATTTTPAASAAVVSEKADEAKTKAKEGDAAPAAS